MLKLPIKGLILLDDDLYFNKHMFSTLKDVFLQRRILFAQ